ncbi:glutathione hydrolase proenzyme [[Candida] anglica]
MYSSPLNERTPLIMTNSNQKERNQKLVTTNVLRVLALALAAMVSMSMFVKLAGPTSSVPQPIRSGRSILTDENISTLKLIRRDVLGEPLGIPTLDPNTTHLHTGIHAMVACDVPICSKYGRDILQAGGNAADAAVTVALCIGSVNSHSSGIGGGGFITSSFQGDAISIDAREMAPAAAHKEMYKGHEELSKFGGLAVGVPGELKGLYELFKRHGSGNVTWEDLFVPVVQLNRVGFTVDEVLANALHSTQELVPKLAPTGLLDSWDFIFKKNSTTKFVTKGDFIRRPNLANTLEMIGKSGSSDIFYDPNGPIVESLVEEIARCGGTMDAQDFANYEVNVEQALNFTFNTSSDTSYTAFTANGASSGLALITGLNFFSTIQDLSSALTKSNDILRVHRIVESMKWMASARSALGDFTVHEANATYRSDLIKKYSSAEWADRTVQTKYSNNQTFDWEHYEPKYELTEPHGTSHFSIVDANGNAVAMTTTVNLLFGSLVYDNSTGIILNNEMDDFSVPNSPNAFHLTPSIYNFIEPGKRPLSSTAPTIVVRGDGTISLLPELVIGAAGGSRITTAIFQAIIRVFFDELPLLETISYPRLHHQLIPEYIMCEDFDVFEEQYKEETPNIIEYMTKNLNHTFYESGTLTVMNGIRRKEIDEGYVWEGVSDYWRKRGEAAGY